jgi:hypothetical protein
MIYIDKDFYYNFAEAAQDSDPEKLRQTVIHELANAIKKNRRGVVNTLNRSGVAISTNTTDKDLVSVVVHQLTGNNEKLSRGMAELIEMQQNESGEKNPNAVPLVANGIGTVFGLFGKGKESENTKEILALVKGKEVIVSADGATTTVPVQTGNWWSNMSGFNKGALVVAVGITAYFVWKHYKGKKA